MPEFRRRTAVTVVTNGTRCSKRCPAVKFRGQWCRLFAWTLSPAWKRCSPCRNVVREPHWSKEPVDA